MSSKTGKSVLVSALIFAACTAAVIVAAKTLLSDYDDADSKFYGDYDGDFASESSDDLF
jgi:hypothetical protein